jgi:hypothetical protein
MVSRKRQSMVSVPHALLFEHSSLQKPKFPLFSPFALHRFSLFSSFILHPPKAPASSVLIYKPTQSSLIPFPLCSTSKFTPYSSNHLAQPGLVPHQLNADTHVPTQVVHKIPNFHSSTLDRSDENCTGRIVSFEP